jgi:hypothetical protein
MPMAKARKVSKPTYEITDISDMEFHVIRAMLCVAKTETIRKALLQNGLEVPGNRVGELITSLYNSVEDF